MYIINGTFNVACSFVHKFIVYCYKWKHVNCVHEMHVIIAINWPWKFRVLVMIFSVELINCMYNNYQLYNARTQSTNSNCTARLIINQLLI